MAASASSLVIKVKYGETLRRFNASIVDNKLSLDLVMLQNKIRGLFTFDSNVKFTMTYVDEDGDGDALASDDDIHGSLKPLRITVKLVVLNTSVAYRTTHPPSPYQSAYQRHVEQELLLKRQKFPAGWPVEFVGKMAHTETPTSGSRDGASSGS